MKLTDNQKRLLTMVNDNTEWAENERPGHTLTCYFVPQPGDYGTYGAGDAATFSALVRKGLIRKVKSGPAYSYAVTEDGILALAKLPTTNE